MARTTAQEPTRATAPSRRARVDPVIRRPKPEDAVDLAREALLAEERVEMGTIAAQLGVSQGTIYRWFGTRERLIEQVLDQLARAFLEVSRAEAQGQGDELVLDFVRRFSEATLAVEPVQALVEREPQLALRVLLGDTGVLRATLKQALADVIAEACPPSRAHALEGDLDLLVEVGVALNWPSFVFGDAPHIDQALQIMRLVLAARATPRQADG
jgi:AcrR family transcriptional regulator